MCSRADYTLEVLGSVFDNTGGRCASLDRGPCDGVDSNLPDIYFIFCLHLPTETTQNCTLGQKVSTETRALAGVLDLSDSIGFLGLPNPLSFEVSGSLPVSLLMYPILAFADYTLLA